MGLSIGFHSGKIKIKSVSRYGKPVFDLAVVARISHDTATFRCVKEIQDKAMDAGLNVQAPPQAQAHIPLISPIFRMEGKGAMPDKKEKTGSLINSRKLCATLRRTA